MRQALLRQLIHAVDSGVPVQVVSADTGFHIFDDFQKAYPDHYLNVGIAEAAAVGISAGLALAGKRPFVYGIVPFVTMRCFEQIRVDLCYANIPAVIVGVGAGLTYGPAGPTHHAIEDIAVMSCLPNMTVVCPGDPVETAAAVDACLHLDGPCYLRLGKSGEPVLHPQGLPDFEIGKGIQMAAGDDLAILATGNMIETATQTRALLLERGLSCELISMPTVKPLDTELILDAAARVPLLVTIEEHTIHGGLGSAVAGALADAGSTVRLLRCAIPDCYADRAGSQACLRRHYGLTPTQLAERISSQMGQGVSH